MARQDRLKRLKKRNIHLLVVLGISLVSLLVGLTLAFFTSSDYASSHIGMSGKVQIEAVGAGEASIEDDDSCNLQVSLDDNYSVLIPGMPISLPANCKVYQSSSSPLLRAKLQLVLTKSKTDESEMEDTIGIISNMSGQLMSIIEDNGWTLHTDGYLYYIGTTPKYNDKGEVLLHAVNVASKSEVINFINDTIRFPTNVDKSYSGMGVKFKITFQAIQDYIPNEKGDRLDNTIPNSLKIFSMCGMSNAVELKSSDYSFTVQSNGTAILTLKSDVTYPETLILPSTTPDGTPISTISKSVGSNASIKNLIVPSSYTSIEAGAFQGNTTLQSINLSMSSITSIPDNCFYKSKIEEVSLPEGLTTISTYAFRDTPLSSINIPSTVTTIKSRAFVSTQLTTLYIPASVTTIEDGPISSPVMQKLVVDEKNTKFYDISDRELIGEDGRLLYVTALYEDEQFEVPNGVKKLPNYAMHDCINIREISFPSTINYIESKNSNALPYTGVEQYTFANNSYYRSDTGYEVIRISDKAIISLVREWVSTLTISDDVVSILDRVLDSVKIEKLVIGKSLQTIGTIMNGYWIKAIEIHEDNQYFYTTTGYDVCGYDNVFYFVVTNYTGNPRDSYVMPEGITTVRSFAFYNCQIKSITLPTTITTLEHYAFFSVHHIRSLIFTNATPPASVHGSFFYATSSSAGYKMYVPDSSVSAYQSKMPTYETRIVAVSTLSA